MSNIKTEPKEIRGLINYPCCDAQLIVYRYYPAKTETRCPFCGEKYLFDTVGMTVEDPKHTIFSLQELNTLRIAKKHAYNGANAVIRRKGDKLFAFLLEQRAVTAE